MSFKLFFNVLTRTTDAAVLETQYNTVYKRFLKLLYDKPQLKVSWSLNGPKLAFYQKKHPEFLNVLSELVSRNQVEITGGGYYDPLMPLTLPIDRVSQLELLTALIKKSFGKKPRGSASSYNFWDESVIDSFTRSGMEWVMLDSRLAGKNAEYTPYIIENMGKSIKALCVYENLIPKSAVPPEEYLSQIKRLSAKGFTGGAVLTEKTIHELLESGWLQAFCELDFASYSAQTALPNSIVHECARFTPLCSLSARVNDRVLADRKLHDMYARIIYTASLIQQCRGDKFRKHDARENMWKAQNALTFGLSETDESALTLSRHGAYRELIEAEKICRTNTGFAKALISLDINYDSKKEYIYKFSAFSAFVLQQSGAIYELDIFKGFTNYAENCAIFSDTLDFGKLEKEATPIAYTEALVDHAKKEIKLVSVDCPVFVKKNYVASENGIQVQYIFKNITAEKIQTVFSSACNFSLFQKKEANFVAEAVFSDASASHSGSIRKNLRESPAFFGKKEKLELFHLGDSPNNVSFSIEPNEESGFSYECIPLAAGVTKFHTEFFWNIELGPNCETEKTIICNIAVKAKKD